VRLPGVPCHGLSSPLPPVVPSKNLSLFFLLDIELSQIDFSFRVQKTFLGYPLNPSEVIPARVCMDHLTSHSSAQTDLSFGRGYREKSGPRCYLLALLFRQSLPLH